MQILTPTGEAAFCFVFKPQPPMAGSANKEPSFQLTLLYEEGDARLEKIRKAIEEVAVAKFGAKAPAMLKAGQLKSPLRDAGGREWAEGKETFTARTTDRPEVVNKDLEDIINQMDFYPGCRARMDVWLYAFDKAGNRGVSAIMNSVQKMGDGERKSGRRPASDAFGGADDDDAENLM